jgi:uncharacterized repeat protein (TIGR01451 family)
MHLRSRPLILLALVCAALLASTSSALGATFTVTNTEDAGAGSLRQAITESNAAGPGNTIAFNIPGSGPFTIAPTSALPFIAAESTTIDGCTQPGADCSGLPLALKIRLDGQGFSLTKNGITIRGFSFTGAGAAVTLNRVTETGLFVLQQNVTIADNYVGLAADGSPAGKEPAFQFQVGLRNVNRAPNGLHILDNVISSNKVAGASTVGGAIDLSSTGFGTAAAISGLRIEGNVIGLDPTGTQPRPNGRDGIVVEDSGDARIVGNTVASNKGAGIIHRGRTQAIPHSNPALEPGLLIASNLIEGNEKEGIAIGPDNNGIGQKEAYSGPADIFGNTVRGNGTGGTFAGISISEAADTQRPNIRIGGLAPGQGNAISANTGAGVAIGAGTADTSVAVTVRANSIFENGGLAIDLASDGPTANGPAGEVRTGPDALLNFPILETLAHGSLIVDGSYEGAPSATLTLDFYKSETEDGPQAWVGSTEVTTDAAGIAPFHAEFEPDVPAGWFVTATAIDAEGNTSEFGKALVVPQLPLQEAPETQPTPPPGTGSGGSGPVGGGGGAGGNPPSASAPPSAPAPNPPTPPKPHEHRPDQGKPELELAVKPSANFARPTSVVAYRITVSNPGTATAHGVEVCDRLPSEQTPLRAAPAAEGKGSTCWRVGRLPAGSRRVLQLTARVGLDAGPGSQRNRATATAANVDGVSADAATVRVRPLPETACGSSLARPVLSGVAGRC